MALSLNGIQVEHRPVARRQASDEPCQPLVGQRVCGGRRLFGQVHALQVGVGEEQLAAIAEGLFDAVLHDRELAALRRLFIVSQYRDPQIGRRLRHYWIEQPLAFQAGVFAGLIRSGDFRDGLDPMATALAFFGPVLALLQLAESGDGAEERARALLRSHVHHFRTTHLHRTAGAEQEAGKAEQTAGAEQETGEAEQAAETEQEAGKAKQEAGTEQAAPVEPSATAGEEAGP